MITACYHNHLPGVQLIVGLRSQERLEETHCDHLHSETVGIGLRDWDGKPHEIQIGKILLRSYQRFWIVIRWQMESLNMLSEGEL